LNRWDYWSIRFLKKDDMELIKKIKSFVRQPVNVQMLCLQATIVSLLVWIAMTLLPFRWWGRWQGETRTDTPEDPDPDVSSGFSSLRKLTPSTSGRTPIPG
jgi:hypothetical protein